MNKKIEKFISDIETVSIERAKLANKLRNMYKSSHPRLTENFIYGGIGIYFGKKLIGGVWVHTKHISIIFSEGYRLEGPDNILEGGGKFRRHIKIFSDKDIDEKKVEFFIQKYVALETEK
ncbi:DUF1801 domain-containing protein [Patescibacteria group bacterium]